MTERKGGGPPVAEALAGKKSTTRIASARNRRVQIAQVGARKLFDKAAKTVFLEWFAATCNIKLAAAKAGVAYQTVFKHRMSDAAFAAAWDRCLAQGYARLEAKMLETEAPAEAYDIAGDLDAPELQRLDPQLGMALLREHKKSLPGAGPSAFGEARKKGRRPRVASNAEVRTALVKRLVVFGIRIEEERLLLAAPAAEAE
jgi:hypothetical protein